MKDLGEKDTCDNTGKLQLQKWEGERKRRKREWRKKEKEKRKNGRSSKKIRKLVIRGTRWYKNACNKIENFYLFERKEGDGKRRKREWRRKEKEKNGRLGRRKTKLVIRETRW